MITTATTVGAYLRDLPPDRRVAMARVCSMIRRSARGVRESMRYGLAFYELDGPLFALESGRRHMSLYVAEQEVVLGAHIVGQGHDRERSHVRVAGRAGQPVAEGVRRHDEPAVRVERPARPDQVRIGAVGARVEAGQDDAVVARGVQRAPGPVGQDRARKRLAAGGLEAGDLVKLMIHRQ